MAGELLAAEAEAAIGELGRVDIVVGVPSFNNCRTVSHVVRAVQAGLARYFPERVALIVNSDGGSTDSTREAVLEARLEDGHLLLLDTPLHPVHRLSAPYHGIPGKGSAFRLIFEIARRLEAGACAVVDSDLRSIAPEWMDGLLRPVLSAGFDFVAPYYHRHKYDGTITNSIVYPLTRALYGLRVRQPIGGDFGMSARMVARYLESDDWESDVARFGIDIWLTTIAVAEGFRVCQSFLGAKLHDAKDPAADLTSMLQQVVGSVFGLMGIYDKLWLERTGSMAAPLYGFQYAVGIDAVSVDVDRMLAGFRRGSQELAEFWALALDAETLARVASLAETAAGAPAGFHVDDELWARIVYEFAASYRKLPLERTHLLRSLTPLYLARVASFVLETAPLSAFEAEERIERLCQCFENLKPRLAAGWAGVAEPPGAESDVQTPKEVTMEV